MKSEETRWLDRDETEAWLALAGLLLTLPSALDTQLQRDSNLTLFEYFVLAALSAAPDNTWQMSHLAIVTNGSLPRLSQVVSKLEKRGWVRRERHPTDARCKLVVLTEAGERHLTDAAPGHVEMVRRLVFDPLTREQVGEMQKLTDSMREAILPEMPHLTRLISRVEQPLY